MENYRAAVMLCARDAATTLPIVLQQLNRLPDDWQLVLVDDGSQDGTAELAARCCPALVVLANAGRGTVAARQTALAAVRAPLVVSLDADVVATAEVLQGLVRQLERDHQLGAVLGAYDPRGFAGEPVVSRFRNLLHSYVHHHNAGPAETFWCGLGALRHSAALAVGGFQGGSRGGGYWLEDVALGYAMHRAGWKLCIDPSLQGVHLKSWTLQSMMHADLFIRAATWTELGWQGLVPMNRLNLSWPARLGVSLLALGGLQLLRGNPLWLLAGVFAYLITQLGCLRFMARWGGVRLALAAIPLLMIHHACCLAGLVLGTWSYCRRKRSV